jgi:hypothetical protein
MRSLLYLNFLFLLLFSACDPVKKSTLNSVSAEKVKLPSWRSPFTREFDKALFRTNLEVANKQLSGISIIKRTSDSSFHFTFANEIGLTYFDLEIYRHNFRADYVFDPVNKKSFLKILQNDFSILFFSASEGKPARKYISKVTGEAVYMYLGLRLYAMMDINENTLTGLAGWNNYFDAVFVTFQEYSNGFPNEIRIMNPKINLTLTLNFIGK